MAPFGVCVGGFHRCAGAPRHDSGFPHRDPRSGSGILSGFSSPGGAAGPLDSPEVRVAGAVPESRRGPLSAGKEAPAGRVRIRWAKRPPAGGAGAGSPGPAGRGRRRKAPTGLGAARAPPGSSSAAALQVLKVDAAGARRRRRERAPGPLHRGPKPRRSAGETWTGGIARTPSVVVRVAA